MNVRIRNLTPADFPACDAILASAFHTQETRSPELARYLTFQPDGWFVAEVEGMPAGMVGAVDYGPFAYLGMMAVLEHHQGRGLGRALMEHCLAWLDGRGCPLTLLDASVAGARLYPKLGFIDDGLTEVWVQPQWKLSAPQGNSGIRVEILCPEEVVAVAAFDARVFGANRAAVIEAYRAAFPERALIARSEDGKIHGYLIVQWRRIGPWVADTPAVAEALLAAALRLPYPYGTPMTIVSTVNEEGVHLLQGAGFHSERPHRHMRRGGACNPIERRLIYGLTSFAIG